MAMCLQSSFSLLLMYHKISTLHSKSRKNNLPTISPSLSRPPYISPEYTEKEEQPQEREFLVILQLGVGSSCRPVQPSGQSPATSPVKVLQAFEELLVIPRVHVTVHACARPSGELLLRGKASPLLLGVALQGGAPIDCLLRRGRRRVHV